MMKAKIVRISNEEYVTTGRRFTKLVCDICKLEWIFDYRKLDSKKPKMRKHIKAHKK